MTPSLSTWQRAAILAFVALVVVLTRVCLPWPIVMQDHEVLWPFVDTWYHARLVDFMASHFPQPMGHDPLAAFPHGQRVPIAPGWEWLMVGTARLLGITEPGLALHRWVALWPPITAAITIWASFGIAHRLFGRAHAWLSLLFAAMLAGAFLKRTVLGAIDHHVAELMWSSLLLWWLLENMGREKHGWRQALPGAVLLSAYLFSWAGGALLLAILALWLFVDAACWPGALRRRMWLVGAPALLSAAAVAAAASVLPRAALTFAALSTVAVLPFALHVSLWLGGRYCGRPRLGLLLLTLAGMALLAGLLQFGIGPIADATRDLVGRFYAARIPVYEATPLLQTDALDSLLLLWVLMGPAALLLVLGYTFWLSDQLRQPRPGNVLAVVWCGAFMAATLAQIRFSLYLTPFLAIGSAWVMLQLHKHLTDLLSARQAATVTLAAIVVVLLVPGINATQHALRTLPVPSAEEHQLLQRLAREPQGGILARWAMGWRLVHYAAQPPLANPTQHNAEWQSQLFLLDNGSLLHQAMADAGLRYLWLDETTLVGTASTYAKSGFAATAITAQRSDHRHWLVAGTDAHPPLLRAEYYALPLVHGMLSGFAAIPPTGPVFHWNGAAWRQYASFQDVDPMPLMHELACPDPARSCVPVPAVTGFEELQAESIRPPAVHSVRVFRFTAASN